MLKLETIHRLTTKINLPAQKSQVTEVEYKTCSVFLGYKIRGFRAVCLIKSEPKIEVHAARFLVLYLGNLRLLGVKIDCGS